MNKVSNDKTESANFMQKAFCSLFLYVFFAKMIISVAPLIFERFDKDSINAAILQLEIEKESKEDSSEKEKVGKELWSYVHIAFRLGCPISSSTKISTLKGDENKHPGFYPTVPTPPPDRA